jgi:predicted molibdopterin-dependent oxidoreductase YjgC
LFSGEPVTGETRRFNSSFGKLFQSEFYEYLKESTERLRLSTGVHSKMGFSREEAILEAERCLHCDCRKADNCILRDLSDRYRAAQKRYASGERLPVVKKIAKEQLIYEPGKCIKCGICVRLTAKHRETFGFTFIGRGFQVEVGAPFDERLESALERTMQEVCEACPTGALSSLKKERP